MELVILLFYGIVHTLFGHSFGQISTSGVMFPAFRPFCIQFYSPDRSSNKNPLELNIKEHVSPGTLLKQFTKPTGKADARVVGGARNFFHFDSTEMTLKTSRRLNSKRGERLFLNVTCKEVVELYDIELVMHPTIVIVVEDVNDPPVFVNLPATVSIEEAVPVQRIIYKAVADDPFDADEQFRRKQYRLLNVSSVGIDYRAAEKFRVDRQGNVIVLGGMDYDHGPREYNLVIETEDGGNPPLKNQSVLTVLLEDSDDQGPRFSRQIYNVTVVGERPILEVDCHVTVPPMLAVDQDPVKKSPINYRILSGKPGEYRYWSTYFNVDSDSGRLCQTETLPRAGTTAGRGFHNFTFTIQAYQTDDHGKSTTAELHVHVQDRNVHAPKFRRLLYRTSVPEYPVLRRGMPIVTVQATDDDYGLNQLLKYELVDNPNKVFSVHGTTGMVWVNRPEYINRELNNTVTIWVKAVESHSLERLESQEQARIEVSIVDVNDNPPKFSQLKYEYFVKDSHPVGISINNDSNRVVTTDLDLKENGTVTYQISQISNSWGRFSIKDLNRFVIDASGNLRIGRSLRDLRRNRDFPYYTLQIKAEDQATSARDRLSSTATVIIHVKEANDYPPKFIRLPPPLLIGESAPVGTAVANMKALDKDGDEDIYLQYGIVAGNEDRAFAISRSANIVSARPLDREQKASYRLVVQVTDKVHTINATVVVHLQDENDHAPSFLKIRYDLHMPENVNTGFHIGDVIAKDPDDGRNGMIRYTVAGGDMPHIFRIKPNGTLFVARRDIAIDRELRDTFVITISASDAGSPPKRNSTQVAVHLTDVNDNAPQLRRNSYRANVEEGFNAKRFKMLGTVRASDKDKTEENRNVRFSLDGVGSDTFGIHPISGRVRVKRPEDIDCETRSEYNLKIIARDRLGTGLESSSDFLITVVDVNDNKPYFPHNYTVRVGPLTKKGTSVVKLKAIDLDNSVQNNRLIYLLKDGGYGKFHVDFTSGGLIVVGDLLREPVLFEYLLDVEAYDTGEPRLSGVTTVKITVPISQPPEMPQSFQFSVREDLQIGSSVGFLEAFDPDIGKGSQEKLYFFSINQKVPFTVDNDSGNIHLVDKLDIEDIERYTFEAYVKDNGLPASTATTSVTIVLTDVNDNPPVFGSQFYQGQITEDDQHPVEQAVHMTPPISVSDKDIDKTHGEIVFNLEGEGSDLFLIDPQTGALKVAIKGSVDCEIQCQYNIQIVAIDMKGKGLRSIVPLNISVIDVNDNPPQFIGDPHFKAGRLAPLGSIVGILQTHDADVATKNNRVLHFLRSGGLGKFSVDVESGKITVADYLTREPMQEVYTLVIEAHDTGEPKQFSSTIVNITVTLNTAPIMEEEVEFEVLEHVLYGTPVGRVEAIDPDNKEGTDKPHQHLEFFLKDTLLPFEVEMKSGILKTAGQIDRETAEMYNFLVYVKDDGIPSFTASTTVTVHIGDINDNPPVFNSPFGYQGTVIEDDMNPLDGQVLAVVPAISTSDADVTIQNRQIRYRLNGEGSQLFRIDPWNGTIIVRGPGSIDCELRCEYFLEITGVDKNGKGFETKTSLNITVLDQNDNAPVFQEDLFFRTNRLTPGGTEIGQIKSFDKDVKPVNNRVSFHLERGGFGKFSVNISTGIIAVSDSLLREPMMPKYELLIMAMDSGTPSLSTETLITIEVPLNHKPVIQSRTQFIIKENVAEGTFVGNVSASDPDLKKNVSDKLRYFIHDSEVFKIDEESGTVRTAVDIDREKVDSYNVVVTVEDDGIPQFTATATLTVSVQDENDNRPIFSLKEYHGEVTEADSNDDPDRTVHLNAPVTASDKDATMENQNIVFSLEGHGSEAFEFDTKSAEIQVKPGMTIDCEQLCLYNLTVIATDRNGTGSSSKSNLTIVVEDSNDNAPVFDDNVEFQTGRLTSPGTIVGKLHAEDHDFTSRNNRVIYLLREGGFGKFAIDVDTGEVIVSDNLTRPPMKEVYELVVEAFDNGSPQLSIVAEVRIHVTLNTPPRVQKFVNVLLEENLPPNSLVTLIRAEDPDIGVNPDEYLRFTMNASVPFSVNEKDGKIYLNSTVDRETEDSFTFTVYVMDHGIPAYTAESLVTVHVKDLNDNPPKFASVSGYNGTVTEDDIHPRPRQEVIVTPTIVTTDQDSTKENRMVRYSLQGNGSELFEIHPHTAEIHVRRAGSLDCERKCQHNLTIIAADQNGTGLKTESKLLLQIQDVNDNIPTIVEKHIFTTGRGAALGSSLGRLKARDNDTTLENNRILFYLKKGGFQKFAVDFYTGEVITASDLTRDPMLSEYKLIVELYDTGEPQLSSSTEVLIKVPKNNPPYTDSHVSLELKENQPAGDVVGKILAEDTDVGKVPGEKLQYSIISDVSIPFAINASTGEIISLVSHDRELVEKYVFGVRVSDNGLPSYSATAMLTIIVTDENDNYPLFQSEGYIGVVIEDDGIPIQNQRVTVMPPLAVEDKDRSEENRDVIYRLEGDGSHLLLIDELSGEIKVKDDGTIDCEIWPEFDLQVIASDRGGQGLNTTTGLLIKVEDLNDNSPELEQKYHFAVGRLTPVGFAIGQIKAVDRDFSAKNNRVHYSLAGGEGSGRFTVDLNTGNITVTSPLTTPPMKNQYSFSLEAYDTGNPPRSTVTKVYVDVPLNTPPRVTSSFYWSVFENNPGGTVVGSITAFDPDVTAASKERLLFTFNESVPFTLNKANGTITTTRILDREVEERFVFPVLVQDNGAPPFTVTTTVTINVWDENDNYPVFDAPRGYSAWVTENDDRSPDLNTVEVHPQIMAQDGDKTSINKLIQYSISGPGSQLFKIDGISGILDLSGEGAINCEDMCRFNLTVSATDRNGTGLQTVTNLTVFVEDVNDNPPIFVQDYEFRLHRSSPVGSDIGTVKAIDQDMTDKNKRVMYHITRGSQGDFEIDLMSGDIRVAASLLREPHTENYVLHLEAIDSGTPQLSATTKVKIYVPKNHAPLLQPNFQFEIAENEAKNTSVGNIYAEDEDVDVSDTQNLLYWIDEKVPFTIHNESGEIYTLRELDKEWEMDYVFSVFVKDDGVPPFTAFTTVKIDIVDLNDNAPKFTSKRGYKARIIEDNILSVGIQEVQLLPALIVTDEDNTKVNRDIRFSLGGKGAGNFKISPVTGEIHAKYRQIDCERQCRYILDLIATDQGGKGNSTVTKILVEVVDVNDNPPMIPSIYSFTTPRLSAVGTEVGRLEAVDGDWTRKNNRLLYYLKDGGLGKFAVNITSGWITVNTPLVTTPMREEYVLHVEVYDTGEPQLWTLTEVIINVPLNKPPSLPREINFTTEENREMGDIIGQVSATDPDLVFNPSEKLSYYVNDTKLPFSVEMQTGLIRAAGSIDLEEDDHFQFVLSVSDNGVPPFTASTTVNVQVLDINDHYPRFNSISGYMASIVEDDKNPRIQTRIPVSPRIMVTDGDETPENREVRFYLEGDGSELFNMDPVTADLSLRRPGTIDCETKCKFHFQIIAADQLGHGLETTDILSIYVGDVNDHKPEFNGNYTFSIARSASIGSSVGIIEATDGDATKRNSRILYSIRSASKGDFIINIQTGEIVVANSLFDEPLKEVYTFTIEATDTGDPPLSSKVRVEILVPMNHPPSIERNTILTAEETFEIGAVVGEVICTDIDIKQDSDQFLTYFMVNASVPFRINATNGMVTTTQYLDSETLDMHSFTVNVRDNGIPEHTVSTLVTVSVQDVNDNAPVFGSKRGYRGLVTETSFPEEQEVIVMPPISARDLDSSADAKSITFSLEGLGHDTFHIDPQTAELSIRQNREIDCETMCKYHLQIIADDGRGLNSSSNLTIIVEDVNDEAPVFEIPDKYVVPSTTEIGAVVGDLKAVDHDISRQNNRVMYFLKDGGYGKFSVGIDSGDIMIADSLIREPMMEDYNLEVEVYDSGQPRLSASTTVKIFVDMNHPPKMELFYVFDVRETIPIGSTISQISATDPDKGQVIEYLLEENDDPVPFKISKSAGIIKTTEYLDREQGEEHIFVVVAKDNGTPPYTVSTIITVILDDVNDNSPIFASGYNYHGFIVEDNFNPKEGQIVRMEKNISVFDRDATEENRQVVISLSGEQADLFVLDQVEGIIKTASKGNIDREMQDAFNLKIVATDQNGNGLITTANLVISIIDENDHAPVFEKPLFTFHLNHLATAGYEVGHVKAYDPDATKPNNDLLFMLEDDPFGKFRLDVRTGKLFLLESFFSKPRKDEYLIKISVTDMGFPAHKALTKVVVKSSGMSFNDFPPEFLGRTIFYLQEEKPVGTLVGRLNIIDKDKNNGSKLNIAIDPGSTRRVPFTVDNDGNIRTTTKIDRDKGYFYFLFNVRATDTGTPPLNTSQEIGVIMEDINDNPPEFNLKVYRHMIYDLFPPNTVVATPFAHDGLDLNPSVYRYRMSGGKPGYFYIDTETGEVKTTRNVERLGMEKLTYTITATDLYNRLLTATTTLQIEVVDSFTNATCCCLVHC